MVGVGIGNAGEAVGPGGQGAVFNDEGHGFLLEVPFWGSGRGRRVFPRPVEARGYLPLRFFFLGVQVMAVSLPLGLRLRLPGDVTAGAGSAGGEDMGQHVGLGGDRRGNGDAVRLGMVTQLRQRCLLYTS